MCIQVEEEMKRKQKERELRVWKRQGRKMRREKIREREKYRIICINIQDNISIKETSIKKKKKKTDIIKST